MPNTKNKIAEEFDIEAHVKDCDVSYRGGNLEVDVASLFPNVDNPVMGAYQNYLGGGIAGAIVGGAMFDPEELTKKEQKVFFALKERIKQYFYNMNAGGGDEYMVENVNSYQKNQSLPVSGF